MNEPHLSFCRSPAGLAVVAASTSADYILPIVLSATAARHHMIQGEVPRLLTAILADMSVAAENLHASDPSTETWALDHID